MSLIHNERTKLTAALFNTLATAVVAAGGFAPLAAIIYGLADVKIEKLSALGLASICIAGGGCLHLIGRALLGSLRE
jgi:hypothetical protein